MHSGVNGPPARAYPIWTSAVPVNAADSAATPRMKIVTGRGAVAPLASGGVSAGTVTAWTGAVAMVLLPVYARDRVPGPGNAGSCVRALGLLASVLRRDRDAGERIMEE